MSTKLIHERWGECELIRVEGVDWIVRVCETQLVMRIPPARRCDFEHPADSPTPVPATASRPTNHTSTSTQSSKAAPPDVKKPLLWALGVKQDTSAGNAPTSVPTVRKRQENKSASSHSSDVDLRQTTPSSTPRRNESASQSTKLRIAPGGKSQRGSNGELHPSPTPVSLPTDARLLRRAFESLRNGLSPANTELRSFAVGIEGIQQKTQNLLDDVAGEGGRTVVLRGAYGQGKTFCLQLIRQLALEQGFAVVTAEIDSHENQLDKPHSVFRSLIQSLTFPGERATGALGLAIRTQAELTRRRGPEVTASKAAEVAQRLLESELHCRPLAWILSDPELIAKPQLLALLACEPGAPVALGRNSHVRPGAPREWPSFTAGTQGDFASYLLSGMGRLARFLGHRGLIIILDEMEKWQDLNWQSQTRAGNLLGGLIWASSANIGSRQCRIDPLDPRWHGNCDHSRTLEHSRRCGGYPFTTSQRCYLGVAIAMTPRGDQGPETAWSDYGLLEVADLPVFSAEHLQAYMRKVFPAYCAAYDVRGELTNQMLKDTVTAWRKRGDQSTRTAIQAVLTVLDAWRNAAHS